MEYSSSENQPASNEEPKAPKKVVEKEPVKKLEGKKWTIENAKGNWELQVEMDQRIHIISSTGKNYTLLELFSGLRWWLNKGKMQLDLCRQL